MVAHRTYSWKEAFASSLFVRQFAFASVSLLLALLSLPYFFHEVIGPKPGRHLNDPVLQLFTPRDLSWPVFLIIYVSFFLVISNVVRKPLTLLFGLQCYLVMTIMRMASMYIFTLEPPGGMVLLRDPIIDYFFYGGETFTKDLFFSGHVSILFLLAIIEDRKRIKVIVFAGGILVGIMMLIQRAHYTVDVLAAPVICFGIARGMQYIRNTRLVV
jgi:hypothetical protein